MEKRYGDIEKLLERFFKGETTNAEERQLYDFFAREEIPESLKPYKELFCYFGEEIVNEEPDGLKRKIRREISFLGAKRWQVWSIGVAASLALFFSIYLATQERYDGPIVGGYIIRNGVCITDMKVIRPELEQAYNTAMLYIEETKIVESKERERERVYQEMLKRTEDPYCDFLSHISDEEEKSELLKIIMGVK